MLKKITTYSLLLLTGLFIFSGPLLTPNVNALDTEELKLENPLNISAEQPIADLVAKIIKAILGILGVVALGIFMFGGIIWMTAGGRSEKIDRGKDLFVWAAIGIVVVFASYSLTSYVLTALTQV